MPVRGRYTRKML